MLTSEFTRPIVIQSPNNTILGAVEGWDEPGRFPIHDSGEPLVYLDEVAPEILTLPAYHPSDYRPLIRLGVAKRLHHAQQTLPEGYQLVLLDGWRSQTTQRGLYDAEFAKRLAESDSGEHAVIHNETIKYVSKPLENDTTLSATPPPHSTGGAVDVALAIDGNLIDFGSDFDEMSEKSALAYLESDGDDPLARDNRRLLYHVMTGVGFEPYQYEWWHYNYGNQMATASHFYRTGEKVDTIYGGIEP